MGFVGTVLSSIFSPKAPQASTLTPTITARDLVSETSSEEPESAVMGSDKKKNNRGTSSLLVQSESLYRGGNN